MRDVPLPLPVPVGSGPTLLDVDTVSRNLEVLRRFTWITPFIVDGEARSTMLALIDETRGILGWRAPAESEASR